MLYAVGDIHGDLRKLDELLAKLPLQPGDRLVFLGDYIDRGAEAAGVVSRLIDLSRRVDCKFLMGNHESMFLDFLGWRGAPYFGGDAFLMNGGDRTLASYGYFGSGKSDPDRFELPPAHERFYKQLVLSHGEGDYLFVHAGLGERGLQSGDPSYALRVSRVEDLLWNRTTAELPHNLGVTIIYGHTPRADFGVRWNDPFSIGIDTGAVYGGKLTALRLPDQALIQTD
ncbi:MAG TPA: metallophosphoesterase family protein [Myxococcota bacterium]|jgi:serine/threonine protein phosphatase 1